MKNNNNKFTKKIISGKYKGKVLNIPSKVTTRSSKTIVLESFFNTLQFDIVDSVFVEVFSGSGSIGLEALSRGAKEIYFMEKDRDALRILKSNIASLSASDCHVYSGDSFTNIKEVVAKLKKTQQRAYVYVDPPFSIREGMEDIYDKTMTLIAALPSEYVEMVIVEHMTGLEIPDKLGNFELKKSKKFGNTTLSYLTEE